MTSYGKVQRKGFEWSAGPGGVIRARVPVPEEDCFDYVDADAYEVLAYIVELEDKIKAHKPITIRERADMARARTVAAGVCLCHENGCVLGGCSCRCHELEAQLAEVTAERDRWVKLYDKIPKHELGIPGMHFISVHNRIVGEQKSLIEMAEEVIVSVKQKNERIYAERNKLVCALSKLFPAWLERHPDTDTDWDDDWRWIVFINHSAVGQMSWHIHVSELEQFDHLCRHKSNSWDGHTVEEKYERLAAIGV